MPEDQWPDHLGTAPSSPGARVESRGQLVTRVSRDPSGLTEETVMIVRVCLRALSGTVLAYMVGVTAAACGSSENSGSTASLPAACKIAS